MLFTSLSLWILLPLASSVIDWDYVNPEGWCTPERLYCCPQYTTQSPIDINTATLNHNCPVPFAKGLDWVLGSSTDYTMKNEGYGFHVKATGSDQGTLNIGDRTFCLAGFHIHYGDKNTHGSGHTVDGYPASAEVHFVHYECKFGGMFKALAAAETLSGDKAYTLAVVGVLYIDHPLFSQYESPLLNQLIENLPSIRTDGSSFTVNTNLQMTDLVRDTLRSNPEYYYYKGSLTTPDCQPFVHWALLRDPMYVSAQMLDKLRSSVEDSKGKIMTQNHRPLQINTNPVYLCKNIVASSHAMTNGDGAQATETDNSTQILTVIGIIAIVLLALNLFFIGICMRNAKMKAQQPLIAK